MSQAWREMLTPMRAKPRYRCGYFHAALPYLRWPTSICCPTVRSPFLTQSKCSDTLVFLFYEWTFYDKMLGSKTLCWVQEFRHWWVHTVSGSNTEVKNRASPHGSEQTPVEKLICPYALLGPAKLLWQGELPLENRHAVCDSYDFILGTLICSLYTSIHVILCRNYSPHFTNQNNRGLERWNE